MACYSFLHSLLLFSFTPFQLLALRPTVSCYNLFIFLSLHLFRLFFIIFSFILVISSDTLFLRVFSFSVCGLLQATCVAPFCLRACIYIKEKNEKNR